MHLARGFLNPVSRDVTRDLASPVALHKTLLRAFPDALGAGPRARVGLLFRVDKGRDGGALLVLQSSLRPDLAKLPIGYFLDASDDRLFSLGWSTNPLVETLDHSAATEGQRFAFRLRANVTKKIGTKTAEDGKRRNGKRVPLRGDVERLTWLERKAAKGGFSIVDARVQEEGTAHGRRGDATVTLAGARFDGLLQVVDPTLFHAALENGIGPAKAYGFGLLSLARV